MGGTVGSSARLGRFGFDKRKVNNPSAEREEGERDFYGLVPTVYVRSSSDFLFFSPLPQKERRREKAKGFSLSARRTEGVAASAS